MSDGSKIRNGLKQGRVLSPLLLNCVLEYAIQKIKEDKNGLILNVLNQLLVYADDGGEEIDALQSNTEVLAQDYDETGMHVNVKKRKYMITSLNTENEENRYITVKN